MGLLFLLGRLRTRGALVNGVLNGESISKGYLNSITAHILSRIGY